VYGMQDATVNRRYWAGRSHLEEDCTHSIA